MGHLTQKHEPWGAFFQSSAYVLAKPMKRICCKIVPSAISSIYASDFIDFSGAAQLANKFTLSRSHFFERAKKRSFCELIATNSYCVCTSCAPIRKGALQSLNYPLESIDAMKYVLVSGGVVSGLGKGVTASSIGVLLKNCGFRVTSIKIGAKDCDQCRGFAIA